MVNKPSNTVVIAGLSDAIALAIARRLAAQGDSIALLGGEALKLAPVLGNEGARVEVLHADVSDRWAVHEAIMQAEQQLGSIKRLICGVPVPALSQVSPVSVTTFADWSAQVEAPLVRVLSVCQGALPRLTCCKGAILFFLSDRVAIGLRDGAAYAAGQSALYSFVKCLARECAPAGVRVNAVATGAIPLRKQAQAAAKAATRDVEQPEELAALADFLLSERASYITGQLVQPHKSGRA